MSFEPRRAYRKAEIEARKLSRIAGPWLEDLVQEAVIGAWMLYPKRPKYWYLVIRAWYKIDGDPAKRKTVPLNHKMKSFNDDDKIDEKYRGFENLELIMDLEKVVSVKSQVKSIKSMFHAVPTKSDYNSIANLKKKLNKITELNDCSVEKSLCKNNRPHSQTSGTKKKIRKK